MCPGNHSGLATPLVRTRLDRVYCHMINQFNFIAKLRQLLSYILSTLTPVDILSIVLLHCKMNSVSRLKPFSPFKCIASYTYISTLFRLTIVSFYSLYYPSCNGSFWFSVIPNCILRPKRYCANALFVPWMSNC